MFEKIVLRRSESGEPISAGRLGEALLFYQRVHLVFDRGTLIRLARQIGLNSLTSLLRRHEINAVYCEESLGTITTSVGSQQAHSFAGFTVIGHDESKKYKSSIEAVQHLLEQAGFQKAESRRFSTDFQKLVPSRKLTGDFFLKGGITNAAKHDLEDKSFLRDAINEVLRLTPGVPKGQAAAKFETWDTELGFYVLTDIDFKSINSWRENATPKFEAISSAHLLSSILDSRADMALASFYGGDFVTSAAISSIIRIRHLDLLRRAGINADSLSQFHSINFPDCPTLQEAIDSGEREFDDLLRLLDKAGKFKEWVAGVSPDDGFVTSYLRDATATGWIQKLPAKSLRYVISAAIGVANPIAGAVAAIGDTFLVERILGGWRPNHFIDNRLSPFLQR